MKKARIKFWQFSALACVLLFLLFQYKALHQAPPFNLHHDLYSSTPGERDHLAASDTVAAGNFIRRTPSRPHNFYQYNRTLSDKIGAFRTLPDTRDPTCTQRRYQLPQSEGNVSVIIVFHNELRSALLRTIMSIYERSPKQHLHELILVDDCSADASLLNDLRQLNFPPFNQRSAAPAFALALKLQRNSRRLGLIESRNQGARLASGDHLLFLDSHCEVNVGWLEPLLERIAAARSDRTHAALPIAVSPVLDAIDAGTLQYRASSQHFMGGFDWNLHFHWVPRERTAADSAAEAFKSPAFAGGVFMISRNWFFKFNGFNSLLEIWGGESIEFSIKFWLCGGQIEIVPCSRIGHVYRTRHPFHFPRGGDGQATYLRNSKIIAESWLDAYKYFFYTSKPAAQHISVNISHTALAKFRQDLQCRPFAWFLRHVFPQLQPPKDELKAFGTLSSGERCLQLTAVFHSYYLRTASPPKLLMSSCFDVGVTHWYLQRRSAQLHSSSGNCLQVSPRPGHSHQYVVGVQHCHNASLTLQRWQRRGTQLMHTATHLCLDNAPADAVTVSHCRQAAPTQNFRFSMEVQRL